jgi:hypothetical protein
LEAYDKWGDKLPQKKITKLIVPKPVKLKVPKKSESTKPLNQYAPAKLRRREIISEIDKFYEDVSNMRIPVREAHEWITQKMRGASPAELQELLAKLRQTHNQDAFLKFNCSEIMTEIDKFYEEASNVRIPVSEAREWIRKKTSGMSRIELLNSLEKLRWTYNK